MTKWICKEYGTMPCRLEDGDATISPDRCPITNMRACWKRDCTTEESSAVFDAFAGVDNRVCHLEKKVEELEQMFRDHTHYISGTTGKSAWREK